MYHIPNPISNQAPPPPPQPPPPPPPPPQPPPPHEMSEIGGGGNTNWRLGGEDGRYSYWLDLEMWNGLFDVEREAVAAAAAGDLNGRVRAGVLVRRVKERLFGGVSEGGR